MLNVDKCKIQQIIKQIQEAYFYKKPELSLLILAQQVGLPTNEFSRIINSDLHQTTTGFVNDFRIAKVREHMLQEEDEKFNL